MVVMVLLVGMLGNGIVFAYEQYDFGGATVRIQTRWHDVTPLGPRGMFNWYDPDAKLQAHIEAVEKMFNAKIEFVYPGSDSAAIDIVRQSVLAGDQEIDFLHIGANVVAPAIDGLFHRLDDVLEPTFYDSYPDIFDYSKNLEGHTVGNHVYGFEALNYVREAVVTMWNKEIFEREGLPNLYEVYESGEWTWDVLREIAYQGTRDTTGEGKINQWGLLFYVSFEVEGSRFWPHTNGARFTRQEGGRIVFAIDEPAFIESLAFLQKLYQDGVAVNGSLGQPNWATAIGSAHSFPRQLADQIGFVPLPKGPRATEHVVPEWGRWMGVIPITVENPRAVIELVKALWQVSEPYIVDGLDNWENEYWHNFALAVSDRQALENWKWATQRSFLSPTYLERRMLEQAGWHNAMRQIMFEGASPATVIAELKPVAQALLDEALRQ